MVGRGSVMACPASCQATCNSACSKKNEGQLRVRYLVGMRWSRIMGAIKSPL